jgi:hypothetical protein
MTTPTHDSMPDSAALAQDVMSENVAERRFSYEKLSSLLRLLGAAVLVASLSIFLFQGWLSSGDLYRFAVLIGFSVLLSGAGLASSHVIGDNVSARLFMAIALCAVVVDFAVAGGLVYSIWNVEAAGRHFPTFATWHLASGATTAAAVTAACIVLTPIVWMAMRALARQTATLLTRLFILACAELLVPVRDENIIALSGITLGAILIAALAAAGRRELGFTTTEGRYARAVVLLPVLVMLGRQIYLYAAGPVVATTVSLILYMAIRQLVSEAKRESLFRSLLEHVAVVPAVTAGWGAAAMAASAWPTHDGIVIPVFSFTFAGLLFDLSVRSSASGPTLRSLASQVIAWGMCINVFAYPSALAAIAGVCAGLGVTVHGYSIQRRSVLASGVATFVVALGYQIWLASHLFALNSWGVLAVLGISAILAAAVLDRHGLALRARLAGWQRHIRAWDA